MINSCPLLSIITPAFNEEQYIIEMIESVRAQFYANWELIVVDDGSSDRTAELIQIQAKKDDRIRPVSLGVKLGKVAAFNLCFEQSRGDIICHIGADDLAMANSFQSRVDALEPFLEHKSVAFSKIEMFKDGASSDIRGTIIPRGPGGNRTGPGITMTRLLAETLFPIPESLPSEDIWLGKGALLSAEHVIEIPKPLVRYRINAGNSNPRHRPFKEMNSSISARMEALPVLAENKKLSLSAEGTQKLRTEYDLELLRRERRTLSILVSRDSRLVDRLAVASMSAPVLWRLRRIMYKHLSGWR